MTVEDFITRTSYALRGTDDEIPTEGSDEANYWISIYNRKKDELARDVRQRWAFTFKETAPNEPGTVSTNGTTTLTGTGTYFTDYRVGDTLLVSGETSRTIATITSDTSLTVTAAFSNTASGKTFTHTSIIDEDDESYSLHRSFLFPSDKGYVTKTDGNKVYYSLIKPQERDENIRNLFITGINPFVVNFTDDIEATESIVGGSLTVPGFYLPDDVSEFTDLINVPDPNWAVMATAAEVAFNDVVYEDKAPDLQAKSNDLLSQMTMANRSLVYGDARKTPTNVTRIRAPRFQG